ncbi:hypothetical protein KCP74_07695 [Salmonella enterica subsp. enterica]|nr:hypothetical protein KCP74_07695 [Salmonella enterica subsp. enterica]
MRRGIATLRLPGAEYRAYRIMALGSASFTPMQVARLCVMAGWRFPDRPVFHQQD